MLGVHQTDRIIIQAIASSRQGSTVGEIKDRINRTTIEKISEDTIRRHMPGLLANSGVIRDAEIREDRAVAVFLIKSGGCVPLAENATGSF